MARTIEKLSAAAVRRATEPGLYGDGAGLWLHVGKATKRRGDKGKVVGKSWIFRFMIDGKARSMGLGSLNTFSLSEARERARKMRKLLLDGVDPLDQRHAERRARKAEAAKRITFKACAEKYIATNKAGWKNAKHADQWTSTLATWVNPLIGTLAVGEIETGHVARVLNQDVKAADGKVIGTLWETRSETASRVRGRIESILSYAQVHGWRDGENPARWRGHLENVLPKKNKVAKAGHHAALPWKQVGAFMADLRKQKGTAARALEFTILTAARTGETIGATWDEIDLKAKVWVIPAERMKAGAEHRIPLGDDAVALLKEMAKQDTEGFVFKSGKAGLSNMAMLKLLQDADRMNRPGATVHGFRSCFADWCAETGKPEDIREAALAHAQGKVIQAYQRGDKLERRRTLMTQWAEFCAAPYVEKHDNVVPLHGASAAS